MKACAIEAFLRCGVVLSSTIYRASPDMLEDLLELEKLNFELARLRPVTPNESAAIDERISKPNDGGPVLWGDRAGTYIYIPPEWSDWVVVTSYDGGRREEYHHQTSLASIIRKLRKRVPFAAATVFVYPLSVTKLKEGSRKLRQSIRASCIFGILAMLLLHVTGLHTIAFNDRVDFAILVVGVFITTDHFRSFVRRLFY